MIPLRHLEVLTDLLYHLGQCDTLPKGYQLRCELRAPGKNGHGHRTVAVATLTDNGQWRSRPETEAKGRGDLRSVTIGKIA